MKKHTILFTFLVLSIATISAQGYQQVNLSKIISFPAKYEGKAVALLGYKVHGTVSPLDDLYAVEVSSANHDVYTASYGDTVTFLLPESIADKITDKIEVGYWMWANFYGHVARVKNNTAAFNPATCIIVDRIDLITDDGELIKRIGK